MAKAKEKGISKMEAMRQTLKALGKDAENDAIKAHLKEKFSVELEGSIYGNYKSTATKELFGGGKKASEKPKAAANGRPSKAFPEMDFTDDGAFERRYELRSLVDDIVTGDGHGQAMNWLRAELARVEKMD
jgi:hypothetical protein